MVTPKDIETKIFNTSFRGYNTDEVDEFLQEICDSYAELYEENRDLKNKSGLLSDAVGQYKSMEDTLQDALSVADKSASEIERQASSTAKEIIRSAEITAQSIVAGAEQKIKEEEYRLESIKREIEIYKSKIVELLNAQLSVLKEYPKSGSFELEGQQTEHTQQMWNKKTEPKKKRRVKNPDATQIVESIADVKSLGTEDTQEIDIKDNIVSDKTEEIEIDTSALPRVSVNENGEYVVVEN